MKETTKQKILLLLLAGAALGFSRSPKNYFKILEAAADDWRNFERNRLYRMVHEFHKERLVDYKKNKDGTIQIILTKNGKKKALRFKINEIKIKTPDEWDNVWRIVIFDIPERRKRARDALRFKLKDLGFKQLQKSVFIYPYECEDEINFVVEFFQVRSSVRFIHATSITNEEQFKIKFKLYK